MNAASVLSSIHSPSLRAQGPLLFFAAVLAVALLSFYVNLLHEQVSRGQQARQDQRTTAGNTPKAEPRPDALFARNALGAR